MKKSRDHSDDEGGEEDEADDVGAAAVLQRTLELVLLRINLLRSRELQLLSNWGSRNNLA